ncbi:MAG: M14 family zinc carboxypeptidase [Rhodanobacteraceae bacterium]
MRRFVLGCAISLAAAHAAAATEWVVEAHYNDRAALISAASRFQHVIVDDKRHVLRVATNEQGIDALENAGLTVEIDQAASARLQAFDAAAMAAREAGHGIDSIPGFQCFRTVEETYQTMDDLVASHPDIVAIDEIGPTWKRTQNPDDGYEMRALRITNFNTIDADPDRPKMVVFSSIHAREYSPAELDTRFAEWLVNNYGSDPEATWLVDHNDFRLVLQANPDARKLAEMQIYQRKNLDIIDGPCGDENEFSQPGIDLNRNFPFHWNITNGLGSSGFSCDQTFRGPISTSEPETQNLTDYVQGTCDSDGNCSGGIFADRRTGSAEPASGHDDGDAAPSDTSGFFVDIHSNASLVLWPWGDTSSAAPNRTQLRTLGRRMAYFNGYTPEQSDSLYPTDGTTDDNFYGLLGVPAFTIETNGSDFFEDCGTFESDTAPRNIDALRYAARTLHAPYELPAGPDTLSVTAEPDLVVAGDPVMLSAHLDSSRFNQSNGNEPVSDINSAAATIDNLPWDNGAVAQAMSATDGAFDSPIEDAAVLLDTTGLASGRHLVYVQGTSVNGQGGTPDATFIEVAQPDEIGDITGVVSDSVSGEPLAADIDFLRQDDGTHHTTTSAADSGVYDENLRGGTFDLTVSADGYVPARIDALNVAGGQTLIQNVALEPVCTAIDDDAESDHGYWTIRGPWGIIPGFAGHPGQVWTDSPNGNYADNISGNQVSLTSQAYDFTQNSDSSLRFDDYCDTESGYDFGHVDVSIDGGTSWNEVYSCSGRAAWQTQHIALPQLDGQSSIAVRFRLTSDAFVEASGWSLDNIRLEYGGEACHQVDNDTVFISGFDPAP